MDEIELVEKDSTYMKWLVERMNTYHYDGLLTDGILFNTEVKCISVASASAPDYNNVYSATSPTGYDAISVFNQLQRNSPMITIINYSGQGNDDLYVRYSSNGSTFSNEILLPHPTLQDIHTLKLHNVYELRLRSPTKNAQFQIIEGYIK